MALRKKSFEDGFVRKATKNFLKKNLSAHSIEKIQFLFDTFDERLAVFFSRIGGLAAFYYLIFNRAFLGEMHAVLEGRKRYYEGQASDGPPSFLLRRNIHRLEKGLTMVPRKSIFGETFINETVKSFEKCVAKDSLLDGEYEWSHNVLMEFFSVVERTPIIERAYDRFMKSGHVKSVIEEIGEKKPYFLDTSSPSPVSFDDLRLLCARRKSVRWFEQRPVPREAIDRAVEIAVTAPSACNRQPFKLHVFDEPKRAQEIGAIPMGTAGFSHNFQCVIVVVGDLSAYPFEKDRHIIYIDTALAVMQLQLAFETQGLSSCTINWPDIARHEQLMARKLNLSPYEKPTMLLAVGYPKKDTLVPFSAKKRISDVIVSE